MLPADPKESRHSADSGSMKELVDRIVSQAANVILGKDEQIRLSLACFLARGHLLIEDVPGVGKTTLAHVLAQCLGLNFNRIQFTSDLLPADILGVSIYNKERGDFNFHPGPIFAHVVLADEINRATPKCQSALLEAMEEQQVSIENLTRPLPNPFFVIATQNPHHQIGTYPLPESQLDRFMMRITMGYPDPNAERALLAGTSRRDLIEKIRTDIDTRKLLDMQQAVNEVFVSDALIAYLQNLLAYTRHSADFELGLSPRAGLALRQCAQAWALMQGRDHVLPEDVQAVLAPVVGHRIQAANGLSDKDTQQLTAQLASIPIP
jgi:MoxR-like ATPase